MVAALGTAYTGTFVQAAAATTIAGPSITEAAGRWIVVALVADNTAAATPTVSSITKPGGEANSWTILNVNSPTATSSAGLKVALAYIYTTVAWTAFSPTATWSASVANRIFSAASFSGVVPVARGTASSAGLTTGAATATMTGFFSPLKGDLIVGAMGVEDGQYVNGGVTANPADTTGTASFTTTGNAAANTRQAGMIGYALQSSINGTYTMRATTAPTQDNIFAAIALAPDDRPVMAGFTWTAATSATINATLNPTLNVQLGDLLVIDYFDNSTVTFTLPAGWTKIGADQPMGGRAWKIATATEVAASTIAVGNGNGLSTSGVRISKILAGTFDPANPIDSSNALQTTVAANPVSTALTIVNPNALVLGVCTATQSTSANIVWPTALAPYDNALTPSMSHAAAQAIVGSGSTGTQTWTGVSTTYLHGLIAIKPATVAPTPATATASLDATASAGSTAPGAAAGILSLVATGGATAPGAATAAIAVTAATGASAPGSATEAVTLVKTAAPSAAPAAATGAVSLTKSGSSTAPGAATETIALVKTSAAVARPTVAEVITLVKAAAVSSSPAAATAAFVLTKTGAARATAAATAALALVKSGSAGVRASVAEAIAMVKTGTSRAPMTAPKAVALVATAAIADAPSADATVTLTKTGSSTAPATATGSVNLTTTAAAAGRPSATGSISLVAATQATARTAAAKALTLAVTAAAAVRTTVTKALALVATAAARANAPAVAETITLTATTGAAGTSTANAAVALDLSPQGAASPTATAHVALNATAGTGPADVAATGQINLVASIVARVAAFVSKAIEFLVQSQATGETTLQILEVRPVYRWSTAARPARWTVTGRPSRWTIRPVEEP